MERTVWSDLIFVSAMLMVLVSLVFSSFCITKPIQTACFVKQAAPGAFEDFQQGLKAVLLMGSSGSEQSSLESTEDICVYFNAR